MSETESKQIFQKKLNELLDKHDISQKELAATCEVSTSTVSSWCKGLNMPRMDKIERLANYFGLPKSYFIEEAPSSNNRKQTISEEDIKRGFFEAAFSGDLKSLTDEQIDDYWEDAKSFLRFKISEGERGAKDEQTNRTISGSRKSKD